MIGIALGIVSIAALFVLTSPQPPQTVPLFSKRHPLSTWILFALLFAFLLSFVAITQKNAGCGYMGDCYGVELPDGFLLMKFGSYLGFELFLLVSLFVAIKRLVSRLFMAKKQR